MLSRPVQIIAGIVLLGWGGLSLAGSIALLRMEPIRNWLFTKSVGLLLLLGSAWVVGKAVTLIRGPRDRLAPFMSIWVIRGFAVAFGAMPFLALLAGTATGWQVLIGGGVNLVIAYRLLRAASEPDADETQLELDDEEFERQDADEEPKN